MATAVTNLPPGFVLDSAPVRPAGLPQGFVLDSAQPQDKDFGQRMAEDFAQRGLQMRAGQQASDTGRQSMSEGALQTLGAGGGMVADTAGNMVGSAARYMWDAMGLLPGDYMRNFYRQFPEAAKELSNTETGQFVENIAKQGLGQAQAVLQESPRAVRNLGAVVDIASAVPAGRIIKGATDITGSTLQGVGTALEKSGANIISEGFDELVRPTLKTAKDVQKAAGQGKLETSFWKGAQKEISNRDLKAAREVEKLGTIAYNEAPVKAVGKISEALDNEVKAFNDVLANSNVMVPKEQVNIALRKKLASSIKNKADTEYVNQYRDLMKDVQNYLPAKGSNVTLTDLLDARKKFDVEYKTGKVVKAGKEARYDKKIIGDVRETLNDMIAQKLPDKGVRESLERQSNLYHALGNVSEKISKEETRSLPGRIIGKAVDAVPGNSEIKKGLAGLGLYGAAAATGTLPVVLGATGIWGTRKLYNSPAIRKAIGVSLNKTGQLLKDGKVISPKGAAKLAEKKGLVEATDGMDEEQLRNFIEGKLSGE